MTHISGGESVTYVAYFDGASRGNPGAASAGAVILDGNGRTLWELSLSLGVKTNNEAEYTALLKVLEELERRNIKKASIFGDSRLVVNQVKGLWKVRNSRLEVLFLPVRKLIQRGGHSVEWIPREKNGYADRLCNEALDKPAKLSSVFDTEKLKKAAEHIYIAQGTEDYAVDTAHKSCTCPSFRHRGDCKHLRAALELEKSNSEDQIDKNNQ